MIWFIIGHIFSSLVELIRISRSSASDKDLEILILRHQLDVLARKQSRPVRPNRAEKLTLAILAAKLKKSTNRPVRQLGDVIRIVRPETVIRWHRMLVRHKWTFKHKSKGGRPRISQELEKLIVRLPRRIRAGATARLKGSCSSWASTSPSPPFAISLIAMVSSPPQFASGPSAGGR